MGDGVSVGVGVLVGVDVGAGVLVGVGVFVGVGVRLGVGVYVGRMPALRIPVLSALMAMVPLQRSPLMANSMMSRLVCTPFLIGRVIFTPASFLPMAVMALTMSTIKAKVPLRMLMKAVSRRAKQLLLA